MLLLVTILWSTVDAMCPSSFKSLLMIFLLRIAWRMAVPTASSCGISCVDRMAADFLLLICLWDRNLVIVVYDTLIACLLTFEDFVSLDRVAFGP